MSAVSLHAVPTHLTLFNDTTNFHASDEYMSLSEQCIHGNCKVCHVSFIGNLIVARWCRHVAQEHDMTQQARHTQAYDSMAQVLHSGCLAQPAFCSPWQCR